MQLVDDRLVFSKKNKEICDVLGINEVEYDTLFEENNEEIVAFFREQKFSENDKKTFKKIIAFNAEQKDGTSTKASVKR